MSSSRGGCRCERSLRYVVTARQRDGTVSGHCVTIVPNLMEVWINRNISPDKSTKDRRRGAPRISEYIITFQVSTGKSASLKLQSNCSFASGSSEGSWYGATYSCARASVAVIRFRGSKTSILSKSSRAITEMSDFERKKERTKVAHRFDRWS